jgi:hypothetical protein
LGTFSYHRIPKFRFYQGVEHIHINDTVCLMADPWKALADYIYIHKTHWHTRAELHEDLRIEYDILETSPLDVLKALVVYYPSQRVRMQLSLLL